jgi:hypothetical protein
MITQQLNTLSTLFLSKWIDTGDKMLDTTLVGIIGILVTGLITYITTDWAQYYNMAVFYLYRMYRNPTDLARVPYRINIFEFSSYEDYRGKAIYSKSLLSLVGNYFFDVLGNKNRSYTNTEINKAVTKYVYCVSRDLYTHFLKNLRGVMYFLESDLLPVAKLSKKS